MALPTLITLLALLLAGWFFSQVANFFKVPRVIGQLAAGLLFGIPVIKVAFFSQESLGIISFLADIGAILLFLYVGLQINLSEVRKNFKESALISILNTIIPFIAGFLLSYYAFDLGFAVSFIIGSALSVSAVAFSLDLLEELKYLETRVGRLIITAGTVDDIFELVLITGALAVIQKAAVGIAVGRMAIDILIFIFAIVLFRLLIIPWLLKLFEKEESPTSIFAGAMMITLLVASLSEVLGLSSLLGALIAGIFIRQTLLIGKRKEVLLEHRIANLVHIISFGFFVPLFFIWVGLNVDLRVVFDNIGFGALLAVIAIAGTVIGTIIGVVLSKGTLREGHIIGWGVTAKGDTELVIATLAFQAGVITSAIFSSLVFMAFATTLIAPIMFRHLLRRNH